MNVLKKWWFWVWLVGLIVISGCTLNKESVNKKDPRYFQDPKFCIIEDDCISYTNCNNQNEPRNKFYDNSLTPNYNPNQKCSTDYFAYAGNDTKCENNICKYKYCHPLWKIESGPELTASEHYTSICVKKNKIECEAVDQFTIVNNNLGLQQKDNK